MKRIFFVNIFQYPALLQTIQRKMLKSVFIQENFQLPVVLASIRMNLYAEAAERSTVCGEDDSCNSSYLCVSFL